MARRRPFSDGRSLSALDGAGHRHPAGLVCFRVGHTPRSLKPGFTQTEHIFRVFLTLPVCSFYALGCCILSPLGDHEAALEDHPQG